MIDSDDGVLSFEPEGPEAEHPHACESHGGVLNRYTRGLGLADKRRRTQEHVVNRRAVSDHFCLMNRAALVFDASAELRMLIGLIKRNSTRPYEKSSLEAGSPS